MRYTHSTGTAGGSQKLVESQRQKDRLNYLRA